MAETDISKIVNLIMENPKIIEEIRELSEKTTKEEEPTAISEETVKTTEIEQKPTYEQKSSDKARRKELLRALKPYVSKERSNAIDSMLSIADVLEIIKTK